MDTGADFGFAHPRHGPLWQLLAPAVPQDDLSHDRYHLQRVYRLCLGLCPAAGADPDLAGAAALVHDLCPVAKESDGRAEASHRSARAAAPRLAAVGYDEDRAIPAMVEAVRRCSWSAGLPALTPLQAVLQDADRLDALGAVGLARTLTCAQGMASRGARLRLYHPDDPRCAADRPPNDRENALDHLAAKLRHLPGAMNTPEARAEAHRRWRTMVFFLDALERELSPRR